MVPLGSHALPVMTLLLLRTFLKLFFWNCLQRHFANYVKKKAISVFISQTLLPVIMTSPLFLPVLLFFCWLCFPTAYAEARDLRMPRKGHAGRVAGARTVRLY